jgi:hypothetical protein
VKNLGLYSCGIMIGFLKHEERGSRSLHSLFMFLKPGADEIKNIVFTATKIRGFLSASSADGGQSSGQSFLHMT